MKSESIEMKPKPPTPTDRVGNSDQSDAAQMCDFFVPAQQCTLRAGHEGVHSSIDMPLDHPDDFCGLVGDCRWCPQPLNCICEHHAPTNPIAQPPASAVELAIADQNSGKTKETAPCLSQNSVSKDRSESADQLRQLIIDSEKPHGTCYWGMGFQFSPSTMKEDCVACAAKMRMRLIAKGVGNGGSPITQAGVSPKADNSTEQERR